MSLELCIKMPTGGRSVNKVDKVLSGLECFGCHIGQATTRSNVPEQEVVLYRLRRSSTDCASRGIYRSKDPEGHEFIDGKLPGLLSFQIRKPRVM